MFISILLHTYYLWINNYYKEYNIKRSWNEPRLRNLENLHLSPDNMWSDCLAHFPTAQIRLQQQSFIVTVITWIIHQSPPPLEQRCVLPRDCGASGGARNGLASWLTCALTFQATFFFPGEEYHTVALVVLLSWLSLMPFTAPLLYFCQPFGLDTWAKKKIFATLCSEKNNSLAKQRTYCYLI